MMKNGAVMAQGITDAGSSPPEERCRPTLNPLIFREKTFFHA
jgi:hypothetical protein